MDMAGFAVGVKHFVKVNSSLFNQLWNIKILCLFNTCQLQKAKPFIDKKEPIMAYKRGFEEETFLKAMDVPPSNFQFLCDHCTKVS